MGDYGKALHFLKKAVGLVKDDPIITEHLGDAYFKLEQYKEALRTYNRAKTLEPEPENEAALDKKIEDTKKRLGR
jgi:tetratricopeptide (TPR) repeat protein